MQDHADPLVERIMQSASSEDGVVPEPTVTADGERGLTVDMIDRLLREHAAEVRRGERMRAESSLSLARKVGHSDGYRAGVEAAVGHLRDVLKVNVGGRVNATFGTVRDLAGLVANDVRPGRPLSREACERLLSRVEMAADLCEETLDAVESLQPVEPVDDLPF